MQTPATCVLRTELPRLVPSGREGAFSDVRVGGPSCSHLTAGFRSPAASGPFLQWDPHSEVPTPLSVGSCGRDCGSAGFRVRQCLRLGCQARCRSPAHTAEMSSVTALEAGSPRPEADSVIFLA